MIKSIRQLTITVAWGFLSLAFVLSPTNQLNAQDLDVPYVPTPNDVVAKMLDLAEVDSSDYVIDLGSGDGRIVIAAAKRGATGHGIDLDPKRVEEARNNAQSQEVDDQILFMEENIFDTDFSKASVITMYLLPTINKKLRPHLLDKLEPGTHIVSHSFNMGDWEADKTVNMNPENSSRSHTVYYWIIPAKVGGTWQWATNGQNFTMKIDQKYQEISVSLSDNNGSTYDITKKKLKGDRLTVQATDGNSHYIFSGRVTDGSIKGMVQHHNSDHKTVDQWSASKK